MTDKQQIEDMIKTMSGNTICSDSGKTCSGCIFTGICMEYNYATKLVNAGYRKVDENEVVLTKSKYDTTIDFIKHLQHTIDVLHEVNRNKYKQVRKETAKEIFIKLIEVAKNNDNKLSIGLLKAWAIEYDVEVKNDITM